MSTTHDTPATEPVNGDGELYGVLAEFDTPGELVEAARRVRDAGYTEFDCYSPFPVHGIDPAMGIKRTILPAVIFGGGMAGALGGLLLQWYCNSYAWTWNISGKPLWSIPANIPIAYELTILISAITAFLGMWAFNKLPQVWHPFFRKDRFLRATDDGFFVGIEARDRRFDLEKTKQLLQDAGAIAIEPAYYDADPAKKVMPKWITAFIVASTAFALIPFAIAAKARNSHSSEPHIHIFPDMDFQPKYRSDQPMDVFQDGRANRGEIPGTVARDNLQADDVFYHGLEGGDGAPKWTTAFPKTYPDGRPFNVDMALLDRGKNRFEIYCTPCHGYDGRGAGMVPERVKAGGGLWQARNLVEAPDAKGNGGVVVQMPNGQLFNTISNGYNTMMGYASQIPHADRWAIVAYVRALQRAQNASQADVPPDLQGSIR
ncbi:MAG TPA: quinol:electron acceptor oxidoreductase subunit ActD [Kofleriaceae bacterium]|nr:quinol:electron acceptor oxidoreductase subunit ActD [Kofleriaceae bacterium]